MSKDRWYTALVRRDIVPCLGCSEQVRLQHTGRPSPRFSRYNLDGRPHICSHALPSWKLPAAQLERVTRLPAAGEAEMLASSRKLPQRPRKAGPVYQAS